MEIVDLLIALVAGFTAVAASLVAALTVAYKIALMVKGDQPEKAILAVIKALEKFIELTAKVSKK